MYLLAAFSIGLLGSLHCVGMCGPLMLSVDSGSGWRQPLLYQTGRLLTYALLGILLGTLGLGLRLWNAQGYLSLLSGGLLVAVAVFNLDPGRVLLINPRIGRLQLSLRRSVGRCLESHENLSRFGLGCCNGLLPCGLVYLAVVGAANTGSVLSAALFMVCFGLGTLPLLAATIWSKRNLLPGRQYLLRRWSPLLVLVSGLLLLYRGYHAAVPLDYQVFQQLAFPPMCH